jgi:hypothetical protein
MSNFGSTEISSPLTAFGEVSVAENTPVIQMTGVYANTSQITTFVSGVGASAEIVPPYFEATCGTAVFSFGSISSLRSAAYRAGQGLNVRWTTIHDTPLTNNRQQSGLFSGTDRMGFGYDEFQEFGIFHWYHGVVDIQELEVVTTGSGDVTVTINAVPYTVTLSVSTAQINAQEIAASLNSQVPLHDFWSNDVTVTSKRLLAGVSGAYAYDPLASGSTAAWTVLAVGVGPTEDWIPQSSWNLDTKDDFDSSKGNVFEITMQYLGFGAIVFAIEDNDTGKFMPVHRIKWANLNTLTTSSNPTFRIGWVTGNSTPAAPSSAPVTIKGASAAGFIQGPVVALEPARSLTQTGIADTTEHNILSIRSRGVFGAQANRIELFGKSLSLSTESTKATIFRVYKGATVTSPTNWQYVNKDESILEFMTDAGTVTGGDLRGSVVIATLSSTLLQLDEILPILLPDEEITITAEVVSGAASDVAIGFNWQEDLT